MGSRSVVSRVLSPGTRGLPPTVGRPVPRSSTRPKGVPGGGCQWHSVPDKNKIRGLHLRLWSLQFIERAPVCRSSPPSSSESRTQETGVWALGAIQVHVQDWGGETPEPSPRSRDWTHWGGGAQEASYLPRDTLPGRPTYVSPSPKRSVQEGTVETEKTRRSIGDFYVKVTI